MINVYSRVNHVRKRVLTAGIFRVDIRRRTINSFVAADPCEPPRRHVLLGCDIVILGVNIAVLFDVGNLGREMA